MQIVSVLNWHRSCTHISIKNIQRTESSLKNVLQIKICFSFLNETLEYFSSVHILTLLHSLSPTLPHIRGLPEGPSTVSQLLKKKIPRPIGASLPSRNPEMYHLCPVRIKQFNSTWSTWRSLKRIGSHTGSFSLFPCHPYYEMRTIQSFLKLVIFSVMLTYCLRNKTSPLSHAVIC